MTNIKKDELLKRMRKRHDQIITEFTKITPNPPSLNNSPFNEDEFLKVFEETHAMLCAAAIKHMKHQWYDVTSTMLTLAQAYIAGPKEFENYNHAVNLVCRKRTEQQFPELAELLNKLKKE